MESVCQGTADESIKTPKSFCLQNRLLFEVGYYSRWPIVQAGMVDQLTRFNVVMTRQDMGVVTVGLVAVGVVTVCAMTVRVMKVDGVDSLGGDT